MLEYLKKFEKFIVIILAGMIVIVLSLSTIDLGVGIVKSIISPPSFLLDVNKLLNVFGRFMLVLIGLELLESIKAYIKQKVIRVEVIFTVALIAVARKVIILDIKEIYSLTLLGIAAIIAALSMGYYLLKRSHQNNDSSIKPPE